MYRQIVIQVLALEGGSTSRTVVDGQAPKSRSRFSHMASNISFSGRTGPIRVEFVMTTSSNSSFAQP